MCGIIGYVGDRDAVSVIMQGLKKLEYRGYDSAGIAVIDSGELSVRKEKGKLEALDASFDSNPPRGNLGIGHVRWSTHGAPSRINSHPHTNCDASIAVVHNGIVENFQHLKEQLILEGHTFRSETDSEVIAHLIEKHLKHKGNDLPRAVRYALRELKGTYAIAVLRRDDPDRFVAARNGSPLIVGLGKGENFIASDASPILKYTKDVIILDDYQMADVRKDKIELFDIEGRILPHKVTAIEWDAEQVEKGGFEHFMLKEIYEQPRIVRGILGLSVRRPGAEGKSGMISFENLKLTADELKEVNRVIIQACGTSYHSGLVGKYIFEAFAGIPAEVEISSEFRHRFLPQDKHCLVLSITQSGETADTLLGLRKAKSGSLRTLSICNVLGSTIARESDGVIYTHAGPEIGVASTKAYTSQLFILYLLAIYLGNLKGTISPAKMNELLCGLSAIPGKMDEIINNREAILDCAEKFHKAGDFLFLGRGINYPNALEGALKLKEISYIHSSGHPAGEMKHGPIALIDEKMPVVCIAPQGEIYEKMVSNIQEVRARNGIVIAIASEGDAQIKRYADQVIYVPAAEEIFSPLLTALPLQLLAYYIAAKKGCDIDQPRNLAKSVTVE